MERKMLVHQAAKAISTAEETVPLPGNTRVGHLSPQPSLYVMQYTALRLLCAFGGALKGCSSTTSMHVTGHAQVLLCLFLTQCRSRINRRSLKASAAGHGPIADYSRFCVLPLLLNVGMLTRHAAVHSAWSLLPALLDACPALPCPALPCPALPCPALPCPALPCPVVAVAQESHRRLISDNLSPSTLPMSCS